MGRGQGEAYGEKGILGHHWPHAVEYCSFSVCSFMDQSFFFNPSLQFFFWGGVVGGGRENPPILSLPRDTSEGRESGDIGSEGEDGYSKTKAMTSPRTDRKR